jgi:hypothetical protein
MARRKGEGTLGAKRRRMPWVAKIKRSGAGSSASMEGHGLRTKIVGPSQINVGEPAKSDES